MLLVLRFHVSFWPRKVPRSVTVVLFARSGSLHSLTGVFGRYVREAITLIGNDNLDDSSQSSWLSQWTRISEKACLKYSNLKLQLVLGEGLGTQVGPLENVASRSTEMHM